jgi:hypothetical protein
MDVKVDVTNVILGSHESTNNAAIWLREKLGIPSQRPILDEFEEYFNCRVVAESRTDPWAEPEKIVFENSADALAFLLKWS